MKGPQLRVLVRALALPETERLEWNGKTFRSHDKSTRVPPNTEGLFLKGPIPISWLARAERRGLSALTIGLELWLLCGLRKSKVVDLNLSQLRLTDARARQSNQRGLRKLEEAGLVRVSRRPGRRSQVEIVA